MAAILRCRGATSGLLLRLRDQKRNGMTDETLVWNLELASQELGAPASSPASDKNAPRSGDHPAAPSRPCGAGLADGTSLWPPAAAAGQKAGAPSERRVPCASAQRKAAVPTCMEQPGNAGVSPASGRRVVPCATAQRTTALDTPRGDAGPDLCGAQRRSGLPRLVTTRGDPSARESEADDGDYPLAPVGRRGPKRRPPTSSSQSSMRSPSKM